MNPEVKTLNYFVLFDPSKSSLIFKLKCFSITGERTWGFPFLPNDSSFKNFCVWIYLTDLPLNRSGLVIADLLLDGLRRNQIALLLGLLFGDNAASVQG